MNQNAESMLTAYYDALRDGEPLSPFFLESPETVKVGLSEQLRGYAEIAAGLAEQTATTTAWTVESHDRSVAERDSSGWFSDRVTLAWTDTQTDTNYRFETRWTGTLEQRDGGDEKPWQFASLHVSAPVLELKAAEDDLFTWDD